MNEKAIAAALEPFADELVALGVRVDQFKAAPGIKGDPGAAADPADIAKALAADLEFVARIKGKDGIDGTDGNDGAGIDAPQYEAGEVYREGAHVVANIGQHFVALQDTAGVPGESQHWQRIGSWGFRHRGVFDKDATYADGDIVIKDFGTYVVVNGQSLLLAGRGAEGKKGVPGLQGNPGKNGRDGATIIGAKMVGLTLTLVQEDADGAIDYIEADFAPAFRELVREQLIALLGTPA